MNRDLSVFTKALSVFTKWREQDKSMEPVCLKIKTKFADNFWVAQQASQIDHENKDQIGR